MLLATTEQQIETFGLRPPAGARRSPWDYEHPDDVLAAENLTDAEKREVLAAWLSDASAVQDEPQLRWLLGTPAPVTTAAIRAAIAELDRLDPAEDWT